MEEKKTEQKNEQNQIEVNENLKAFIQKLMTDEELAARMSQCKTPEEAYAVASSVQQGFTMEEFVETMTKVNDAFRQELSEEDLAKVAGGDTVVETIIGSVSYTIMVTIPVTACVVVPIVESLSGAAV